MKVILLLQTSISFDFPLVAALVAFNITFVKASIDIVKGMFTSLPSKVLPVVGVVLGYVYCLIALAASKATIDRSILAQMFFAALLIQAGAMGATKAQDWANAKRDDAK